MARQTRVEWPDPNYPPPDDWPVPIGLMWRGPYQVRARFRRVGAGSTSKTFSDWPTAAAWLAKLSVEVEDRGRVADKRLIEKTTLSQALSQYLQEETPHKRGAIQEKQRINYWIKHPLGQRHLSSLTVFDFQQWVKKRTAEGAAPTTITNALSPISKTYRMLATMQGFEGLVNPIVSINRPKSRRGRDVYLNEADEARLLAACQVGSGEGRGRKMRSPWLAGMVRVAIATALRQGEIRALKVKDLHLDQSWLRVEEAKDSEGSRPRDVPLTPQAVSLFREILAGPRPISGGVFVSTTKDQVTSAFSAAAARAGMPEVTFHDLRHTGITRLATVIGDPMELSKYTGHRSLQVLLRYYNPTAADLAKRFADKASNR